MGGGDPLKPPLVVMGGPWEEVTPPKPPLVVMGGLWEEVTPPNLFF